MNEEVKKTNLEEFRNIIEIEEECTLERNYMQLKILKVLICYTEDVEDRLEKIRILLKLKQREDSNDLDWKRKLSICLPYAIGRYDYEAVKLLIEHGADVNDTGYYNRTFLVDAIEAASYINLEKEKKEWEMLKLCLRCAMEYGADMNVECRRYKFQDGPFDLIELLEKTNHKKELYEMFSPYKDRFTEEKRKNFEYHRIKSLF